LLQANRDIYLLRKDIAPFSRGSFTAADNLAWFTWALTFDPERASRLFPDIDPALQRPFLEGVRHITGAALRAARASRGPATKPSSTSSWQFTVCCPC
jgi:hypothetical protein